jgi:hypothetical protein
MAAGLRQHPADHLPDHRPAAEHGQQLRRHRRHARDPGRRPGGARPDGARPIPPRLRPPQAPRLRAAEGARHVPQGPERGRVLAGRHRDRGRARGRRAARHRRRPVGLAAVREPGRPAARRDHAAAGAVDDPGDPRGRRPRRFAPGQVRSKGSRSRHPPFRIIQNGRGCLPSPTALPVRGAARTGSGSRRGATPSAGRARGGAWRRSSRARRRSGSRPAT